MSVYCAVLTGRAESTRGPGVEHCGSGGRRPGLVLFNDWMREVRQDLAGLYAVRTWLTNLSTSVCKVSACFARS